MSSQYEYEVVWDGTHRGQNADLLIAGEIDRQYQVYKDRPIEKKEPQPSQRTYGPHRLYVQRNSWEKRGHRGKRRHRPRQKVERFCLECGQQFFLRWPKEGWKHGGRMFCGARCQGIYRTKHNSKWRTLVGEKVWLANRARTKLRRILPAQPCEVCGTMEKIHRHHRDHDPFNNAIANIAFLCEPHHLELHRREANEQPF